MNDCIFCRIVSGDAPAWKVLETDLAYAFLDIHPVAEYHALVIPKRHARDIFEISREDLLGVSSAVKDVVDLYCDKLGLRNVQVVNSSGAEAQQDVFHLHVHVVPRRLGDGQDVNWTTYPEMTERFDELLNRLR